MWSPYFDQLLEARALINTRRGFASYPLGRWALSSSLPVLPIDHCFVSPDIAIHNTRKGPPHRVDHLPLIVDLGIPEMNKRDLLKVKPSHR